MARRPAANLHYEILCRLIHGRSAAGWANDLQRRLRGEALLREDMIPLRFQQGRGTGNLRHTCRGTRKIHGKVLQAQLQE